MTYDVLIAGGGVAGSACAILLRQLGLSVRLLEKAANPQHYKKLCTHFVQPVAVPVLQRLSLAELCDAPYSVRTRATFMTPAGLIDPQRGYGAAGTGFALNLERSVLDPALRRRAVADGVELGYGEQLTRLEPLAEGWRVTTSGPRGEQHVDCRLLIAADGRASTLAKLLDNASLEHENQRATFFAYCSGVPAPALQCSLFAHQHKGMAFLYPLAGQRTLLSAYIDKEDVRAWPKEARERQLLDFFDGIEGMPSTRHAVFETPVYGYHDYPSQSREPVCQGVPFIGDAALSLDPMSGVGCSFALLAAAMLADAVKATLHDGQWNRESMSARYRAAFEAYFAAHAHGIIADSRINKDHAAQQSLYRSIVDDAQLQRQYLDLTGRLVTPAAFQSAYLLCRARLAKAVSAQHTQGEQHARI